MNDRLAQRGYLPGGLKAAFERVDRRSFTHVTLRSLAGLDIPLPVSASGRLAFSPRATALLLLTLDIQPGHRVLIDAPDGGYVAALASELAGPSGRVVLATGDAKDAASSSRRLRAEGYAPECVRAVAEAPYVEGAWDRILIAEETPTIPTPARHALADLGALVVRIPRGDRVDVVRVVRAGPEFAEMRLGDLSPADHPLGPGVEEGWPVRRVLALEEALRRVWTEHPGTPEEAEFERAVFETWKPTGASTPKQYLLARKLFHMAYVYLMAGDVETAEDAFRASLATAPTAEAMTFLGWTWSFTGRFEEAIDACERALVIDPSFGNAYNDIGAYLIELGRPDEAVEWLERAMRAPRYEARSYPYANLARARLMIGDRDGARDALEHALRLDPEYAPAKDMLRRLDGGSADDESADDGADAAA